MYLKVRSRNASADQLRRKITVSKPTVLRLGSQTPNERIFSHRQLNNGVIEINSAASCGVSNDKYLMKLSFDKMNVPTAKWEPLDNWQNIVNGTVEMKFPMIIKHIHSSKGNGIYFIKDMSDLIDFSENHLHNLPSYIIEEYKTYSREYRVHVDKFGCFLAHRKMLKNDAEVRWHRHHTNTVWIKEDNPMFDKPTNWDEIVRQCQNAIASVGLAIGCVDVKVQNNTHDNPKFIVLETNSAPALGEETAEKYLEELRKLIESYN